MNETPLEFFQAVREFVEKQNELVKQMTDENVALRAEVAKERHDKDAAYCELALIRDVLVNYPQLPGYFRRVEEAINQFLSGKTNDVYDDLSKSRTEVARLTAALETIAACSDCMGPGCPYCDDGTHPPSHEARIARRALGRE